jgi:hypothetical protein
MLIGKHEPLLLPGGTGLQQGLQQICAMLFEGIRSDLWEGNRTPATFCLRFCLDILMPLDIIDGMAHLKHFS